MTLLIAPLNKAVHAFILLYAQGNWLDICVAREEVHRPFPHAVAPADEYS